MVVATMTATATKAVKFDGDGKIRFELIPVYPLYELALVYTIGAIKYSANNWRLGMEWMRIVGAMLRHITLWVGGQSRDPDGQHHLASVAWCAFTLMEYENSGEGDDDRQDVAEFDDDFKMVLPDNIKQILMSYQEQKQAAN